METQNKQLTIFDQLPPPISEMEFDYGKGEFKEAEEPESEEVFEVDELMIFLDEMNTRLDADNKRMRELLDKMQEGWSEDEKLYVRDPKEWSKQQSLKNKEQQKEKAMAKLTTEAIETLKNSKVEGMTVKLPEGQLDRKVYLEVKNSLELIGGKWKGGKIMGFVFQQDPTEFLEQISNGEKRNLKKEYQFFATPDDLADELVSYADINNTHLILEPSAGQGAIVKAIQKICPTVPVYGYELMPLNQTFLSKIKGFELIGGDFLKPDGKNTAQQIRFDRIVANPPFSKNQDIDHIKEMYNCLKQGGRLVSVASKHWRMSNNKKEKEFKQWLSLVKAEVHEIEAGAFKESGTMISSVIIVIDK